MAWGCGFWCLGACRSCSDPDLTDRRHLTDRGRTWAQCDLTNRLCVRAHTGRAPDPGLEQTPHPTAAPQPPSQAKRSQTKPNQTPSQAKPNEAKPSKPNGAKSNQTKPNHPSKVGSWGEEANNRCCVLEFVGKKTLSVCLFVRPSLFRQSVCLSVCLYVYVCMHVCAYIYIYTACCVFLLGVFAWVRTLTRAHQMMELQMHRVRTITCRLAVAAPPGSQSNANDHHWYNMQIPHSSRCVGFVCCTNGGQLHRCKALY